MNTELMAEVIPGTEKLIGASGDEWAWIVSGILLLVTLGTFIWQSRKSDEYAKSIAKLNSEHAIRLVAVYTENQLRNEKYLEATHRSLQDTASAMQEITLTLRQLPEPLRASVAPIADKIDLLREDIKETNRKIEGLGQ
jgi:hypothetical protein